MYPELRWLRTSRPLYDEDKGGGGSDDSKKAETNLDSMSNAELKQFAQTALEAKRNANAEAKGQREEIATMKKEQADSAQKLKDEDATLTERLAASQTKIDELTANNANIVAQNTASTDLLAKGFNPKNVALLVETVTSDNVKDKIKTFSEDFKADLEDKPKVTFQNQMAAAAKPKGTGQQTSKAGNALTEMRDGGVKK